MFAARIHGKTSKGFTLLELLVVIVIIGLLAAYVGPKYFSQLGKSEVTIAKAQIEAFDKALDTYRLDVGRYPSTEEGLASLLAAPATAGAKWNGPYLKKACRQIRGAAHTSTRRPAPRLNTTSSPSARMASRAAKARTPISAPNKHSAA